MADNALARALVLYNSKPQKSVNALPLYGAMSNTGGGAPSIANQLARALMNVPHAIGQAFQGNSYGSADPNNAIADAARQQFWRGSVFGVPEDVQQRNIGRAANIALTFAGPMAKTADLGKMAQAQQLEAAGVPRDQIWNQTGWFKGPEGKWKFEINDSAAKVTPDANFMQGGGTSQGRFMDHPALYEAYPDLQNINVKRGQMRGGSLATTVIDGTPVMKHSEISIGTKAMNPVDGGIAVNANEAKSINLHELQHAIQAKEGFATGGSPTTMAVDWQKARDKWIFDSDVAQLVKTATTDFGGNLDSAAKYIRDAGLEAGPEHIAAAMRLGEPGAIKAQQDSLKAFEPYGDMGFGNGDVGRQLYRRLAGEAEARNVQKRMDWPDYQRQSIIPEYSSDVLWKNLIIKGAK